MALSSFHSVPPPFITTLGMMYMVKGAVNVLSEGRPVYPFPWTAFNALAQTRFLASQRLSSQRWHCCCWRYPCFATQALAAV